MTHLAQVIRGFSLIPLIAGSAVSAQTAERPAMNVGDSWTYRHVERSDGNKAHTVRLAIGAIQEDKVSIERVNVESGAKDLMEFTRDLNYVTDGVGRDTPSSMRFSWPMALGKVTQVDHAYVFGGGEGRVTGSCTVAALEKVKVPAGEFDSFRVECKKYHSSQSSSGRILETYWYAPAARRWVKEDRDLRGSGGFWWSYKRELISVELKN